MTQSLPEVLQQRLQAIEAKNRRRQRRPFSAMQGPRVQTADGEQLVFCSNDYLGLAGHPKLREAWVDAVQRYGVGSTASQYINGHSQEIAAFEEELADFLGYSRSLLFGAGYLVNTGVIDALMGRDDRIVSDRLNHASLIDGCRLSGATVKTYAHADVQAAEASLTEAEGEAGHTLLLSDGVFSMDGDLAPLPQLVSLAQRQQAWLMVDDAHGLGVLGPQGRGSVAAAGLGMPDVPILTGTLGKSFGVFGAFVAGDDSLIDYLSQVARTLIFTTALPPALVASLRVALPLLRDGADLREQLQNNIQRFRSGLAALGLPGSGSSTPIQPLVVGSEVAALAMQESLRRQGIWVSAIRPPTVPEGTCRLRVTLSAAHTAQDVDQLLDALALAWQERPREEAA